MLDKATIKRELELLEIDTGRLVPDDIVIAARNPSHPLHEYFEWNDGAAAAAYRRQQATQLIRTVKNTMTVNRIPIEIPQYLRDPTLNAGAPRSYRRLDEIRKEEDSARATIVEEMRRIAQAVKRAKSIAAAFGLIEDIDKIDDLVSSIAERAQSITEGRA